MCQRYLHLHQKFDLELPQIDHANGNVVVICRRFYALAVIEVLRLQKNHTSTPK